MMEGRKNTDDVGTVGMDASGHGGPEDWPLPTTEATTVEVHEQNMARETIPLPHDSNDGASPDSSQVDDHKGEEK